MDNYRAIVLGATGAVGSVLVRELLQSPRCAVAVALTRRDIDEPSPKFRQYVVDMENLERDAVEPALGCDVAFCTMGIGQPSKVSPEELWKVDVEQASAFARVCRTVGVRQFSILTAVGGNSKSKLHYLRVKGEIEGRLQSLGFPRVSFFRPSLLQTKTIRYGFQDSVVQRIFPLVSWALPGKWHEIPVEDLARAMRLDVENPLSDNRVEILHYPEFRRLIRRDQS